MGEDKTLEFEKDTIKQQVAQSSIIADALERHEKENKRLWIALLCCIAALMLMAGSAVYAVSNAQRIANEAMLNALNSVAEIGVTQESTITTTTQTAEAVKAIDKQRTIAEPPAVMKELWSIEHKYYMEHAAATKAMLDLYAK